MDKIRNFCIIAHIDHGKSTLADRLLEYTKTIQVTSGQMLDDMDLERERGITIKSHAIQMEHEYEGTKYVLNLIDTPGHVDFSYEVSRSIAACEGALLIVDSTQGVQAQTISNLYMAIDNNLEIIPVINKIDMVKREEVLLFIDAYRKEYDFAEIVPVSARNGDNTDELVKVILKYLPYGPQFYDEDTVTDQPERQIVAELIREKALHCLQEEIPHGIAVAIDRMKMQNKVMHIDATIICERDSHKGIIIGKQGSMLKKIGSTARYEIERMLDCKVNLKLWVKVQKNWRDSDFLMKNFGYHEDEM